MYFVFIHIMNSTGFPQSLLHPTNFSDEESRPPEVDMTRPINDAIWSNDEVEDARNSDVISATLSDILLTLKGLDVKASPTKTISRKEINTIRDACQVLSQEFLKIRHENIVLLKQKLKKFSQDKVPVKFPTYADIAAKEKPKTHTQHQKSPATPQTKTYTAVITPNDKIVDIEKIRTIIKDNKIKVDSISITKDGFRIKTSGFNIREYSECFENANYKVQEVKKLNPTVSFKIPHSHSDVTLLELEEQIKTFNEIEPSNLVVNKGHAIFRLNAHDYEKTFHHMQQKIFLNGIVVRIFERTHVKICYKCLNIGHIAKFCKRDMKDRKCLHCGLNHDSRTCPTPGDHNCYNCATKLKSVNCHHKATDFLQCQYLQKEESLLINHKIDYGPSGRHD